MPTPRSPGKGSRDPDGVAESRFTVSLPGITLGSFREVSGIGMEWETMDYAEGGNNQFVHRLPVRLKYQNIVLKRGVTHHEALLQWLQQAQQQGVRKKRGALTITLMGPGGEDIRAWSFSDAFPIKWTGPALNASSNQIAMETLEIAHTGMTIVSS